MLSFAKRIPTAFRLLKGNEAPQLLFLFAQLLSKYENRRR